MNTPTVLVAGIGNIFLGDDGFGVAAAQRWLQRPARQEVRVTDFGIRGLDLAYALLEPHDLVVLLDTVQRGAAPGTLHVLELPRGDNSLASPPADGHGAAPVRAIELALAMGATLPRLVLVGCEPESFGSPDGSDLGLSPAVAAAVDAAVRLGESVIEQHFQSSRIAGAILTPCTN